MGSSTRQLLLGTSACPRTGAQTQSSLARSSATIRVFSSLLHLTSGFGEGLIRDLNQWSYSTLLVRSVSIELCAELGYKAILGLTCR